MGAGAALKNTRGPLSKFASSIQRVYDEPVEMVLGHLLEGPCNCALLCRERFVKIDLVFALQMPADESGIAEQAIIVDIRNLALRSFREAHGMFLERQIRHPQQGLDLRDERARVRETEVWTASKKLDHVDSIICTAVEESGLRCRRPSIRR